MQADPFEIHFAKRAQKCTEPTLAIEVDAVACDILRDNDEFTHAVPGKGARFIEHIFHRAAAVLAAKRGDNAVGTVVIAPLGDAEVCVVGRCGAKAGKLVDGSMDAAKAARHTARHRPLDGGDDLGVASGAEDAVDFGHFLDNLILIALREAAGDEDLFDRSLLLPARGLQNRVDRLFFGAVDKAAGVDNDDLRVRRVIRERMSGVADERHHLLGVDEVFRAAER